MKEPDKMISRHEGNVQVAVSVAIPTYGRDRILLDVIRLLLELNPRAAEILVVDQTPNHDMSTQQVLEDWHEHNHIRWLRLPDPSIPHAMNVALLEASQPLVLFLDDDDVPSPALVAAHAATHCEVGVWAVIGQVLQPGETAVDAPVPVQEGLLADLDFPFYSVKPCFVKNVMAGNLSVNREFAIRIGGFDENFVGAAYRFETEFARRVIRNGGRIRYNPEANVHHLRVARGGTRLLGNHLRSASPSHSVGDYYFALLEGRPLDAAWYSLKRMVKSVLTKFHLLHPWWIGPKLVGEIRGLIAAIRLKGKGPRLLGGYDITRGSLSD